MAWNTEELEGIHFSDHFLRDMAERWYEIIYPEMTHKDPEDLIRQMSLVSLDQAQELKEWFEL